MSNFELDVPCRDRAGLPALMKVGFTDDLRVYVLTPPGGAGVIQEAEALRSALARIDDAVYARRHSSR